MPDIIQAFKNRKPFSKTAYRAWNFSSGTREEIESNINIINEATPNNIKQNPIIEKSISKNDKKGVSKALASREQGVSKALASREQGVSKALASREQGVSDPVSKNNVVAALSPIIPAIGKELKLLLFLHQTCVNNCSLITNEITTKSLNDLLEINSNRLRNLVLRLSKKKLIRVVIQNCSKEGAYRIFEFSKEIYDKLLSKVTSINSNNHSSQALAVPLARPDVCSSYINTTTNVPEFFQQIDYSPLKDFGFDESHIIQIYREYTKNPEIALTTEIIQNSINALAFDLKHNDVAGSFKNSPTVVLTALLKKGQPYSSKTPHKVLSPREEAMQEYIAAQEKRHHKIQELENKTKEFKLQEWLKSLSEQELATFAPKDCCPEGMPEKVYQTSRRKKALTAAKEYFTTMLWPQKLSEPENLPTTKPETKLTTE